MMIPLYLYLDFFTRLIMFYIDLFVYIFLFQLYMYGFHNVRFILFSSKWVTHDTHKNTHSYTLNQKYSYYYL